MSTEVSWLFMNVPPQNVVFFCQKIRNVFFFIQIIHIRYHLALSLLLLQLKKITETKRERTAYKHIH